MMNACVDNEENVRKNYTNQNLYFGERSRHQQCLQRVKMPQRAGGGRELNRLT